MSRSYRDLQHDPLVMAVKELRQAQQSNAQQIADVTANMRQLTEVETRNSEKLGEFIAAVKVITEIVKAQGEDIQEIKKREEKRQQTQEETEKQVKQNTFTFRNNLIYWLLGGAGTLLGLLNFASQHLNWK